jgi:hypothetical protein
MARCVVSHASGACQGRALDTIREGLAANIQCRPHITDLCYTGIITETMLHRALRFDLIENPMQYWFT